MKRAILISAAVLALVAPSPAGAETKTFNLLLAGGSEPNQMNIWLTPDGRSYVIDSSVPLEVGGTVCLHPEGNPNELICQAPVVTSFEINSDGGDDKVSFAPEVLVPVTMRGGSGNDYLRGGGGPDKIIGSHGEDRLVGGGGDDFLNGGLGMDVLLGGAGDDVLIRAPGPTCCGPVRAATPFATKSRGKNPAGSSRHASLARRPDSRPRPPADRERHSNFRGRNLTGPRPSVR